MGLDFNAVFAASPNPYMLLDRELRYVAANPAYLKATSSRLEELVGRYVLEAFPDDKANPGGNAARLLASLRKVLQSGQGDVLPLIPYRIPVREGDREVLQEHFWSATHTPLLASDGSVEFILQHTVDVTELERLKQLAGNPSAELLAAGVLVRAHQVQRENASLESNLSDLKAIFQQAPGFMAYLRGEEHVFEFANDAYIALVGGREVVGKPIREALPEVEEQGFIKLIDEALATGKPYVGRNVSLRLARTTGAPEELVTVDFIYQPVLGPNGERRGLFVQGHDITLQRRAEMERERLFNEVTAAQAAAHAANQRLQSVFAQAPVGITILRGPEFRIEQANHRVCEIWGRDPAQVVGRPLFEALPEVVGQGLEELLADVRASGVPYVGKELHIQLARGPNGAMEDVVFNFVYHPLRSPDGTVDGIVVVATEVTSDVLARKQAEAAQAELEAIFKSFPEAVYVGNGHQIQRANPAAMALLGFEPSDALNPELDQVIRQLNARRLEDGVLLERSQTPFAQAMQGKQVRMELVLSHHASKEDRVVRSSGAPIHLGDKVVGAIVTHVDITDKQRSQDQLKASQERLLSVLQASGAGTWELDVRTSRIAPDVRAAGLFQLAEESVAFEHFLEQVHPRDRLRVRTGLKEALEGRDDGHFSAELQPLHRPESWIELRGQVFFDSQGKAARCLGTALDITERKKAEREISYLASVLEQTRDFVGIATLEGKPFFVNASGRHLVGLDSMAHVRATHLLDYFVEEQRDFVRGTVLSAVLRDGYWEGELKFLHFQTHEELPVLYAIFPLVDAEGQTFALATITRDLRAQKAADQERTNLLRNERQARAQAEEANRLKDEFLAMVSHELRTPLTSMLGWVQMLRSGALPPDKRSKALETVERNARAQAQLIEDLLDVSRIMSGKLELEPEPVDIAGVVGSAVETVRPAAQSKGVQLSVTVESGGVVTGDPHRLQQVIWNLLSNAVKFTPSGGNVWVEVERLDGQVCVQVKDTGAGIPPSFLPHVFERFRQAQGGASRGVGGLGLGLSIVRHLVEAHGGEVSAHSDGEGQGALFRVLLPVAEAPRQPGRQRALASQPEQLQATAGLAGIHILLVDDETDSREYVRTLLQGCHVKVTEASNARDALATLRQERPDLLLSDIAMPEEDGYSLIRKVRGLSEAEGGKTPAVALTAYARTEDRARAMLAGFQNHVTKPVEPVELLAVVAAVAART